MFVFNKVKALASEVLFCAPGPGPIALAETWHHRRVCFWINRKTHWKNFLPPSVMLFLKHFSSCNSYVIKPLLFNHHNHIFFLKNALAISKEVF